MITRLISFICGFVFLCLGSSLYITADPLTTAGASVPVYVVVYTKDRNSNTWYQLGTTYKGTATVVSYVGGSGTGSFNTDTWRSTDGKTIEDLV